MHVMVDLETLDTHHTGVILSIGAVMFEPGIVHNESWFYNDINITTNLDAGRTINESTLLWWMNQSDSARRDTFNPKYRVFLRSALMDFAEWFPGEACIWGNGANFDISLLADAYHHEKIKHPWKYDKVRCHRTLKNLPGMAKHLSTDVVTHNALDDAKRQAYEAAAMLAALAA